MTKHLKILLNAPFIYVKHRRLKVVVFTFLQLLFFIGILYLLTEITEWADKKYEGYIVPIGIVVFFISIINLTSWLNKKLFLKNVRIVKNMNRIELTIGQEKISLYRNQILEVKTEVRAWTRKGVRREMTKLVIISTNGRYVFSSDNYISQVEKVKKWFKAK